jgi:hypothetical protein
LWARVGIHAALKAIVRAAQNLNEHAARINERPRAALVLYSSGITIRTLRDLALANLSLPAVTPLTLRCEK